MNVLEWEGCDNVRDLGGLETTDGTTIRTGALVRADDLVKLRLEGWEALREHGVTRIVDLRFADDPRREPPVDVEVVRVELMRSDLQFWHELDANLESCQTADEHLLWMYEQVLQDRPDRLAEAVGMVAEAEPGCVVVHCRAGKDRTGILVALLLAVAGVRDDAIAGDYACSEAHVTEVIARWIDETDDEAERRRRAMRGPAPVGVMVGFLRQLESRYGGASEYLRASGVSDATLERIRNRLRA
jgi:protein tyrosine/serine phosphatase